MLNLVLPIHGSKHIIGKSARGQSNLAHELYLHGDLGNTAEQCAHSLVFLASAEACQTTQSPCINICGECCGATVTLMIDIRHKKGKFMEYLAVFFLCDVTRGHHSHIFDSLLQWVDKKYVS